MLRWFLLIVFLSGIPALVRAQAPEAMYAELQKAMEAAQAAANRPGDASLDCDALENELGALVNQPAVQAYFAKAGAAAQAQTQASAPKPGSQAALTLFGSIVPGAGWAALGGSAAQAQAQQPQAAKNMQLHMQQAQEMIGILPQIMRGQRLIELAQAGDCQW